MTIGIKLMLLFSMIFCHIIGDFIIQGWLGVGKLKLWWLMDENTSDHKYKFDYITVMILHSFVWSFLVTLPLLIHGKFDLGYFILVLPINAIVHSIVDDLRCNKLLINLTINQLLHIVQICITWSIYIAIMQ